MYKVKLIVLADYNKGKEEEVTSFSLYETDTLTYLNEFVEMVRATATWLIALKGF